MALDSEAEDALRAVLAREPDNRAVLEGLSALLVQRGAHVEAASLLARALAGQTGNAEAMERLGRIRLAQGDSTGALAALTASLSADPRRPTALYLRANLDIQRRDFAAAIAALRLAVEVDPSYAEAQRQLGLLLSALGRPAEALPVLLTAMAALPEDADVCHAVGHAHLVQGQTEPAVAYLRRTLDLRPGWDDAKLDLATALVRLRRLDEAETLLKGLSSTARETSRALILRASVLESQNRIGQARQMLDRSLQLTPDDVETLFRLGVLALGQNDPGAALTPLQRAARLLPGEHAILVNLANALHGLQRYDEAATAAEAAVAIAPQDPVVLNTLGTVREAQERHEEAVVAFHRAHAGDLTLFAPRFNLARALRKANRLAEAEDHARRLVADHPGDWRTHDVLGSILALRLDPGAEDAHRRAVALAPPGGDAFVNLTAFLKRQQRFADILALADATPDGGPQVEHARLLALQGERRDADVVALCRQILETRPGDIRIMTVLAESLHGLRRLADEAAVLEQILAVQPEAPGIWARLVDIRFSLCDWSDHAAFCARIMAGVDAEVAAGKPVSIDIFNLQALPVDLAFIATIARSKARNIAEIEKPARTAPTPRTRGHDHIRLGYALPYTYFHSLPLVLKEVIERHDRSRLSVHGYSLGLHNGSEFSRDYRAAFDTFTDLAMMPPRQQAERLRADGIDVLIDVTGHTAINCMPLMAHRPAPVQAHFLGYSITTGADYIDYLITDARYLPPETAALCSEKLVYLPDTFMATVRAPIADRRPTRGELGLPEDAFVLANFNHPCKIDPESFARWMEILRAVPRAVLWLGEWFPDTRDNLRAAAAARHVDPSRLVFAPIAPHREHLARLSCADLAIDNFIHGGGITTVDALWTGLPVISVPGALPGARLGLTLLSAIGIPDLVRPSAEDYVATVIALASDPVRLASLRARVAMERDSAPLFDQARYARNLDAAVIAMWENHASGRGPRPIAIEPDNL